MRNTSHRRTALRSLGAIAVAAIVATPLAARPALAQSSATAGSIHPDCAAQPLTEDACQLSVDIFRVSTPLITSALAGGAPITDIANGSQRFRIGLRVSAVNGFFPDLAGRDVGTGAARSTAVATEEVPVPVPTVDVSAQLFPGIRLGIGPLGFGRVGAVSALASATYLPDVEGEEDFSVTTEGSGLKFGFGGRVGIVEGLPFLPDLSASWEHRSLPTTNIAAYAEDDSLSLSDMSLASQSIRVIAAKRFPIIGITAGWGQDRLDTKGKLSAVVRDPLSPVGVATQVVSISDALTLSRYFAGLSVALGPLGIGAEIGQVSGDAPVTYNTFDGADEDSRLFGTVTLRLAF
ncbi:MAG TPA: hypothetical protein VFX39_06590 [Gemmatimonadaceae bacterium]|nr:hypothetical protein [Gemmatimonadaceae bacterium]